MPTDLLAREEARDKELVEDDGNCIICECRPLVSLCGRYVDGPLTDRLWDDVEMCPECVVVLNDVGCPGCGCPRGIYCRLCGGRPWWRRWLS